MIRSVALKELPEKDLEIQQLRATSRDATQVQPQLHEEIRLKKEYIQQQSDVQVMILEEKARFKEQLHEMENNLE